MNRPFVDRLSATLCLGCATWSCIVKKGNCYVCSVCGYTIACSSYRNLVNYAANSVYYGYLYREAYEKQLAKKKRITTCHALADPSALLVFCALAALSGVIGNASYDLVKKIVKRLASSQNNKELVKEVNIRKLYVYLEQHHCHSLEVDVRVRQEIEKEQIIWTRTDAVSSALANTDIARLPKKEMETVFFDALTKAASALKSQQAPSSSAFMKLWSKLEEHDD